MGKLSLADRATIANMSPEYGATMGFFPVDHVTLDYLKLTGRSDETVCFSTCKCKLFLVSIAMVVCGKHNHKIFVNAYISPPVGMCEFKLLYLRLFSRICSIFVPKSDSLNFKDTKSSLPKFHVLLPSILPFPFSVLISYIEHHFDFCEKNSACTPFYKLNLFI
jgi:hypothetical protein